MQPVLLILAFAILFGTSLSTAQDPGFPPAGERPASFEELAFGAGFEVPDLAPPGTEPRIIPGLVPVIDAANLSQAVLDHIKRLFEIAQRAILIIQGVQNLESWFLSLLNLPEIPYRDSIISMLNGIGELLREFEALQGQYQALTYALQHSRPEFDLTFPGWRSLTELTTGSNYTVLTEAGVYSFPSPLEFHRYQYGRTLQVMRQILKASSRHRTDLKAAEEYLAANADSLTELAHGTAGTQQILEMSTAFTAMNVQQLVALRNQVLNLTNVNLAASSLELNREMEAQATLTALHDEISGELQATYGAVLPSATAAAAVDPLPFWMESR